MEFYLSELWELAIDILGLMLCGLALIQLIRIRQPVQAPTETVLQREVEMAPGAGREGVDRNDMQAMKMVSERIRRERQKLEDILDAKRQAGDGQPSFSAVLADVRPSDAPQPPAADKRAGATEKNPLQEVLTLVQRGMDIDAIERETGVTRGEIVLVRKMSANGDCLPEMRFCA
jgi:hypothetical protein